MFGLRERGTVVDWLSRETWKTPRVANSGVTGAFELRKTAIFELRRLQLQIHDIFNTVIIWRNFNQISDGGSRKRRETEVTELSWKVGDPAASLEISGGTWPGGFVYSNLNNDPETFWHSGIYKQIMIFQINFM